MNWWLDIIANFDFVAPPQSTEKPPIPPIYLKSVRLKIITYSAEFRCGDGFLYLGMEHKIGNRTTN